MPLTTVIMPKTGAEMEEGRILAWKRKEGERVNKGEVLLEIETDKATMEVDAPESGVLLRRIYREGEAVPATRLIAILGAGNESPEEVEQFIQRAREPVAEVKGSSSAPQAAATPVASVKEAGRVVKASPLARRLAQEKGVDLARVQGSGPDGRIEKDDVLRALEVKAPAPVVAEVIPLSPVRRAIARRVVRSKSEIPDFSVTVPLKMTGALRRKEELAAAGTRATVNDLLIHAVARALLAHPDLNSSFESDSIRRHGAINIGFAVGTEDGLYVPVIRNAERLTIEQIAAETQRLSAKAEQKKLTEEDMADGTFTVSNLGMFGVESFTAIIVPPQTAILSVGAVVDRPVRGEHGEFVWQPTMLATLTVDHRVIDGLEAARFLRDLQEQIPSI
ncbi:MAG TPA: dihydrolipoamide acetyltransferase family protein [Terriglobia bacterium]|nr:dihydrolipoamide acetyltransferase family protein [Terriglobia bacterium]